MTLPSTTIAMSLTITDILSIGFAIFRVAAACAAWYFAGKSDAYADRSASKRLSPEVRELLQRSEDPFHKNPPFKSLGVQWERTDYSEK